MGKKKIENAVSSSTQPIKKGKNLPQKKVSSKKQLKKKKANPFEKLSKKDPQFFEYLQKHGQDLLKFNLPEDELDEDIIRDEPELEQVDIEQSKKDKQKKLNASKQQPPLSSSSKLKRKRSTTNEQQAEDDDEEEEDDYDDEICHDFDFSDKSPAKQQQKKKLGKSKQQPASSNDDNDDHFTGNYRQNDILQINSDDDGDEECDEGDDDKDDLDDDDEDEDEEDEDDNDENDDHEGQDADEDDEEDEQSAEHMLSKIRMTEEKIASWSERLQDKPDKKLLSEIVICFRRAVHCISGKSSKIRIEASTHFNAIFKLVLLDMYPAMIKVLKLQEPADGKPLRPKKSAYWKRYATVIKVYLSSLLELLDSFSSNQVLSTLLKHLLSLVPFYLNFVPLLKRLLRQVAILWSEGEEQVRVLSFLILLRMLRDQRTELVDYMMKKLHISYVKNCKFVDQRNWSLVQFMRQSLVELYSLDQAVAYQHAFIFLRQCAITLRQAMMSEKKEGFKQVYNWQFVHELLLWSQMFSCLHPSDILQPLLFPFVQVAIGTIRLIPSAKYIPLRFHLVRALIKLSAATNIFIPIMPYILEVLDILNRGQKYKVVKAKKKISLDVLLKVPNEVLGTTDLVEMCVAKVYELSLEYLSGQSHSIAFPELAFGVLHRLRKFIKDWKNPADCRMLKQLIDKVQESANLIETNRRAAQFNISEREKVLAWEKDAQLTGTPLYKFYEQWCKISTQKELDIRNQQTAKIKSNKRKN